MALSIPIPVIINMVGYFQLELSAINAQLRILSDPKISDKTRAESEAFLVNSTQKLFKLIKTIEEKTAITIPKSGFTNAELQARKLI